MAEIGIIGAGSFGGALSIHLSGKGHRVTLWTFSEEEYRQLKAHRDVGNKLPGVKIPEGVAFTMDLSEAARGKDCVVLAVPSVVVRSAARNLSACLPPGTLLASVAKGLEEGSLLRLSQVIGEEIPGARLVILSGPSHAEEVAVGLPTVLVAGSREKAAAETVQELFMNDALRVYTSPDLVGMELGAALKNVIALAAGMSDGLGFGDNAKAALITRGIAEITRLAVRLGGADETLAGLTGVGDLVVTCMSRHSRNRKCGEMIGQGVPPEEAIRRVGMVVEGANTARAALALSRKEGVSMPITEEVCAVLSGERAARDAVGSLMGRDRRQEDSRLAWEG